MPTAGGRIGLELDRFMQDAQRKLNELAEANNALSERVASLEREQDSLASRVSNLPERQDKIEERMSDLHTQFEHACSSHDDLMLSLDSIRKDCSASKGAVDEILEQHKYAFQVISKPRRILTRLSSLVAKVRDLAHSPARATTPGSLSITEGHKLPFTRPLSEPAPPKEPDDARPSSEDSFETSIEQDIAVKAVALLSDKQSLRSLHRSHMVQTANTAPPDTMLPPPRPDPAVTRNPALQRGRRVAVSSPPKPAFQREGSVASTITLLGDDSPAKKQVDLPPPAPVARRGLRAKSPTRTKRKLAEADSELPTKQRTVGGSKKCRVAASSTSKEGTPKTGDESVGLETGTVNSTQNGPSTTASETVTRSLIDLAANQEIEEGENIVVLPRKILPRYGTLQQDFAPSSTLNAISGDDTILATDATDAADVQASAVEHPQAEAGSRGVSPETPEKTSLNDLRAIFQVRSGGKAFPSAAVSESPIVYTRAGKSTQSTREKNKKKVIGK